MQRMQIESSGIPSQKLGLESIEMNFNRPLCMEICPE